MRLQQSTLLLYAFLLPKLSTAWSLPQLHLQFPFSRSTDQQSLDGVEVTSTTTRIAIIGAGAGGTSAAFWIAKARDRHGADIHVDVYEQSDYIGGRKLSVSAWS